MIKEHSSFVKQLIAIIDCVLIVASFSLAYQIVSHIRFLYPVYYYWFMVVGFIAFYLYFAWTRQLFSIMLFTFRRHLLSRVVVIFFSACMLGAAILYVLPDAYNSRWLYVLFVGFSFILIATEKLALKWIFSRIRKNNRNTSPILIFGRGRAAAHIDKELSMHPEWGLRVIKKIDFTVTPLEFEHVLRDNYIEEVYFCIPRMLTKSGFVIDPFLQICEEMGRPARVFLNIPHATHFARWEYHRFLDRATLISHTVDLDPDQLVFKRTFDILGATVGLLILAPIYPFLALAIKLSSPGPVFFKQVRVGKNGKRFVIYKFRSMSADAEELKKKLEALNELKGAIFKMKNDPRVTPIGAFIRKFSLDELPQFINVFKGEMSIVGTRPPTPDEVAQYQKWHHRRISIRPGLTGLWQVSGRNRIVNFDEVVKLDLKYIDNWSMWRDIQIVLKTIVVLFKRDTAF